MNRTKHEYLQQLRKVLSMSSSRTIPIAAALVAGLLVPFMGIGAAFAAPSPWERYVFEYGPDKAHLLTEPFEGYGDD